MVNIGLLGDAKTEPIEILRSLVKNMNQKNFSTILGSNFSVIKTDLGEESIQEEKGDGLNERETMTIHPHRVVFREERTNKAHTIFAPGGDRTRAVIKMGIITISRIASQIIASFTLNHDMEPQFAFFNDVRFFPEMIHVIIDRIDLIEIQGKDKEKRLRNIEDDICIFFARRKIKVGSIVNVSSKTMEAMDLLSCFILMLSRNG